MARLQLALDIGGTFTDVVMVDGASGALWTAKTPSTPKDPSDGFFDGVEKILRLAGTAPADVAAVFHGSTIATNAVLEGKGARTGMLVTAGFRYVLEIGRHEIPRKENLFVWRKPKRPVPPRLIMEVPERVLLDGQCRAAARRGGLPRGGAAAARARRRGGGDRLSAFLCQPGARAARGRDRRRGISRGRDLDLIRRAAGVPRIRALDGDGAQRLRAAARRHLYRPPADRPWQSAASRRRSW